MIIQLDLQSDTPIYLQLRERIIEGIATKELAPGEGLPSVRNMAADLGVNMQTVNKTYQLLKSDGFILIHRQKGVVINPDGFPMADEEYLMRLNKTLSPLIAEAICRNLEESQFLAMSRRIYADIRNEKIGGDK